MTAWLSHPIAHTLRFSRHFLEGRPDSNSRNNRKALHPCIATFWTDSGILAHLDSTPLEGASDRIKTRHSFAQAVRYVETPPYTSASLLDVVDD